MQKFMLSLLTALFFSCAVNDDVYTGIRINIFETIIILPIDLYLVDDSDYASEIFSNIHRSEYLEKGQINTVATKGDISQEQLAKYNEFNANVNCGIFKLIVHEVVGDYGPDGKHATYLAFLYNESKYLRITTTDIRVVENSLDYYRRGKTYVDSCQIKPIRLR